MYNTSKFSVNSAILQFHINYGLLNICVIWLFFVIRINLNHTIENTWFWSCSSLFQLQFLKEFIIVEVVKVVWFLPIFYSLYFILFAVMFYWPTRYLHSSLTPINIEVAISDGRLNICLADSLLNWDYGNMFYYYFVIFIQLFYHHWFVCIADSAL